MVYVLQTMEEMVASAAGLNIYILCFIYYYDSFWTHLGMQGAGYLVYM